MSISSLLIVKIGAIGDVVMSLPMLRKIREDQPQAKITWICGSQVASLLAATQLVDELISIDETVLLKGSRPVQILSLLSIWKKLHFRFFDLVLTLHADPRYRFIAKGCRTQEHRFYDRKGPRLFPVFGRYQAEEALRLYTQESDARPYQAQFPPLQLPAFSLPESLQKGPFIVFAPGGAKNVLADDAVRRWPIESYAILMKSLSEKGFSIVVTGGESDQWVRPFLSDIAYTDLMGSLSLLQLVALLEKASLLITHDSGPMHLAKLTSCPVIALFGPTTPAERIGKGENITAFWGGEHLACRPCYDGKTYAACTQNVCLQSLSPAWICQAALQKARHGVIAAF